MKLTEEMIAEDEKRWGARDVVTELGYCGKYMRDRKDMTNLDIRFYAYIMRKAHYMLKTLQPCNVIHRHNRSDGFYDGNCPLCGALLDSFYNHRFCGTCGQVVKWE